MRSKALALALALTLVITAAVLMAHFMAQPAPAARRLLLASTTSTQNSGLLDWLMPKFEKATGIKVHVIAVGTGAALEYGKRGDTDLVMVHAKSLELELLKEGWFVERRDVMYNDFVIIGPKSDPAGVKGSSSAADAFRKINGARGTFVSRGDNSGTHMREIKLWKQAGLNPAGSKWYMEVGQGMFKTQRVASEKQAYTITDRGTWLSKMDMLDLDILFEGDPPLFNQYGIMAVNPERHGFVKYKEAMELIKWITSPEGQKAIADYRTGLGEQLFTPNYKGENGNAR